MTKTVKERIKTEFQQVKVEGKERATRIGDILKDAASMTFDEIKAGSSTLNVSARKSIKEILEDLNETAEVTTDNLHTTVATGTADAERDNTEPAPSWKTIVSQALIIVRERKGNWLSALKEYLSETGEKFDQDMCSNHGDRYLKVKQIVKIIINRINAAQASARQANGVDKSPHQSVNIELIDDDMPSSDRKVRLIEPEA